MALGIDLGLDVGRHVSELKPAGVSFVGRYYRSGASRWPALSASEARLISSVGIDVVAVWEGASTKPSYFSYLSGVDDSTSAFHQAHTVGQPVNTPIYFAVDYDASDADVNGRVKEYFRGVRAGLDVASGGGPSYLIGVYGSGRVCQKLLQTKAASFSWLAASRGWAGNQGFTSWNLKQSLSHISGLTFDHDSDESQGNFGGFRLN